MVDAIVMDDLNTENVESNLSKTEDLSWSDTLHGVLSNPEKTFSYMLDNPKFFNDQKATQSFFFIFLIGLASGCAALSLTNPFFLFYHHCFIHLLANHELDTSYLFAFWLR